MAFSSAAQQPGGRRYEWYLDVFVKDLTTGTTTRVSTDAAGAQADGGSYSPSISSDGRYVAFYSYASNLVAGDTNGFSDIFVKDLTTGMTTRVSTDAAGAQADGGSYSPSISSDGQYVAFSSTAANLHPADMSPTQDVFRATNPLAIFANIGSLGMPGVSDSSVAWGDYDNDGKLDILLTGYTGLGSIAKVYHNNGDGTFTENTSAGLTGVSHGSVAWGDYDNDGKLDILLTGMHRIGLHREGLSQQRRRDLCREHFGGTDGCRPQFCGVGGLRQRRQAGHPAYRIHRIQLHREGLSQQRQRDLYREHFGGTDRCLLGSVAWGDYDNDGKLDILLTGYTGYGPHREGLSQQRQRHLYREHSAGLTGVDGSSVAWGDYDNDGKLDILLTGYDWMGRSSRRSITTMATGRLPRTLRRD